MEKIVVSYITMCNYYSNIQKQRLCGNKIQTFQKSIGAQSQILNFVNLILHKSYIVTLKGFARNGVGYGNLTDILTNVRPISFL